MHGGCSNSSANSLRSYLRAQLEHPLQRAARALAHIFGKFYLEAQITQESSVPPSVIIFI